LESEIISLDDQWKPSKYHKSNIVNLKICTIKPHEIIGLEEMMLESSTRITSVTWVSKKAKVIQINATELFSKIKNLDIVNSLQTMAYNKIKFLAERIHWYRQFQDSLPKEHKINAKL
jgi:DNA helicase IV